MRFLKFINACINFIFYDAHHSDIIFRQLTGSLSSGWDFKSVESRSKRGTSTNVFRIFVLSMYNVEEAVERQLLFYA
jgi:hypothetical protein